MGEWDDIGRASISQTGPKFNPHHTYTVEVTAVKDQTSHHGNFFIVETVVHESDDPDLPADTRPSWSANKKHPQTKGRILCFTGALFGIDPKDEAKLRSSIQGVHIAALIDAQQQLGKGRFVRIITGEKETQTGRDFTLHDFAPYVGPALASRINNPTVAAGNSAAAAQAALPQATMPGAFVAPVAAPGGFLPPPAGFPGLPQVAPVAQPFPQNGLPMPSGLSGLSTLPPVGAPMIPQMGAPGIPGVPGIPGIPGMGSMPPAIPMAAPLPPAFPPPGWTTHPQNSAYFFKPGTTQQPVMEAQLRQMQAAGQA